MHNIEDMITPKELYKLVSHVLSKRSFQYYIQKREENGLSPCVTKMSKKLILINRKMFFEWLLARINKRK